MNSRFPFAVSSLVVPLLGLLMLTGCPVEGEKCTEGLAPCADSCVDTKSDRLNCGACGLACAVGQVCVEGGCQCRPDLAAGQTDAKVEVCGGECAVLSSNPRFCGSCDNSCAQNEVCQGGTCQQACALGFTDCAGACVKLSEDPNHCGACGNSCGTAQSCSEGRCQYDVIAACLNVGQVVGLQADSYLVGARKQLGARPQALAAVGDVLIALDAENGKLLQANIDTLAPHPQQMDVSTSPNHVLVDGEHLYVVNSVVNTLSVFKRAGGTPAPSRFPEGLGLSLVTELQLGDNTSPQAAAKLGDALYVPLWGNAPDGGKVVKIDVSNPAQPTVGESYDLSGLDLKPFPGVTPSARPYHIVAHANALWVPLNNLDESYKPGGPGLVVRIDPSKPKEEAMTVIDLGASDCTNAGSIAAVGTQLVVGCIGDAYDSNFQVSNPTQSGVALLDASGAKVAFWSAGCPSGVTGCSPASVTRLTVVGDEVWVGDAAKGRVFVLEVGAGTLTEKRGFSAEGAPPLDVCPFPSGQDYSLVSDVVTVP